MDSRDLINAISTLIAENEILKEKLTDMKSRSIDIDKFYNVPLTTEIVSSLHSVPKTAVRRYAKLGLIPLHPLSTDSKILIRASEALLLDFKEIKKQYRLKLAYEECKNFAR